MRDRIVRERRRVWWTVCVVLLLLAAAAAGALLAGASRLAGPLVVVGASWTLLLGLYGIAACLLSGRRPWRFIAVAGLLLLVAVAGLEAVWPEASVHLGEVKSGVVIAVLVLGSAYTLGLAWNLAGLLRSARLVREDARAGWVDRFEGTVEGDFDDPAVERLVARGYLAGGPQRVQRLEILPRSSLVVRANGRPVEHWARAHVAQIAPLRPFAFRIDLPHDLVRVENDPSLTLKRRSLSPAERKELAGHIDTLRRRYWPSIVVTVGVAVLVGVRLRAEEPASDLLGTGSLLWYAVALFTYLGYVRRVRAARRLQWDRELRWLVTVHDRASLGADGGTGLAPKLEMLPISQLVWTEDARPAAWRTSKL